MFQDAIKAVCEAEASASAKRQAAILEASQALEHAEKAGEAKAAEAIQKAEAESLEMIVTAEAEATRQAQELASSTESRKAVMRARAEVSMDKAVQLIMERVVGR